MRTTPIANWPRRLATAARYGGQFTGGDQTSSIYDPNGNPTGTGVVIGAGNRLLSDGTYNYTYDAAGNMLSQTNITTHVAMTFTYDADNRLSTVVMQNAGGQTTANISLTYDLYGQLIGRSATTYAYSGSNTYSTTTTGHFVYDPVTHDMVLAFNGNSNLTNRFLYGPAVEILAQESVSSPLGAEHDLDGDELSGQRGEQPVAGRHAIRQRSEFERLVQPLRPNQLRRRPILRLHRRLHRPADADAVSRRRHNRPLRGKGDGTLFLIDSRPLFFVVDSADAQSVRTKLDSGTLANGAKVTSVNRNFYNALLSSQNHMVVSSDDDRSFNVSPFDFGSLTQGQVGTILGRTTTRATTRRSLSRTTPVSLPKVRLGAGRA